MKFEEKTYYKLCHCPNYRSMPNALESYLTTVYTLKYAVGEITKPKPGTLGIFVFGTMEYVRRFTENYGVHNTYTKLFECKVVKPVLPVHIVNSAYLSIISNWAQDIKLSRARRLQVVAKKYVRHGGMLVPPGTFSVGAVKLIREVG